MDDLPLTDYEGGGSPIPNDPFGLFFLMNFDGYSEACSPTIVDQIVSTLSFPAAQQESGLWASLSSPRVSTQMTNGVLGVNSNMGDANHTHRDNKLFSRLRQGSSSDCPGMDVSSRSASYSAFDSKSNEVVLHVPPSLQVISLEERMLKALSLVRESSCGGILAQVWMPINHVLELVTTNEKCNFDTEMEKISEALEAVNLRSTKVQASLQNLTKSQLSAFSEILDVSRYLCHAYMLPLALSWVPIRPDGNHLSRPILCIQESACYVHDTRMQGFLHACAEHSLETEQGIAGKALQSNHPFFSPDVKEYDIQEYPLVHHARKFNLHAAVAIRVRSTYTGDDDYILEFFLPVNCAGTEEQQLLLNILSSNMKRICRSLRSVSDAEKAEAEIAGVSEAPVCSSSTDFSIKCSQPVDRIDETTYKVNFGAKEIASEEQNGDAHHEELKSSSVKQVEKKPSTTERHISLSVLQRYFSGSLKDAAKNIGVCPTTLKRICRQHGILRWPSRKINKVNRSLQKIQSVIRSVQGAEGAIKYDPSTGCLVAAVSSVENPASLTLEPKGSFHSIEKEHPVDKMEPDRSSLVRESTVQLKCATDEFDGFSNDYSRDLNWTCADGGLAPNARTQAGTTDHSCFAIPIGCCGSRLANLEGQFVSGSSSSAILDKTQMNAEADGGDTENNNPSPSSSMTESSSDDNSIKNRILLSKTLSFVTVKATCNDGTVRFKYSPSSGSHHLFEEIGRRFKLPRGTFQLKYMDDEEEWVMLENDADLEECIDVMENVGSRHMKLQVRYVPCNVDSSTSSNYPKL
ncbi:protein NLP2-like isoform X2 [Zingiber officinale]|uniref:protein NLP2-like isoform X2 n=1 Tax=Zingiber officinale TaxID=94328 RepID=UPI001C4D5644|nr:protein NLP2-like isoform X2 [Zingiber officinale]